MSTYTQILYHIVFATKNREAALDKPHRDELYRFIWGCLDERHCHLYRIGGIEDHVHILTGLHPTVSLSDLIKELKTASSAWIKGRGMFPRFRHWQDGYGAFTHAIDQRHGLIEYIRNQEIHHQKTSFLEEYQALVEQAGLPWSAEYLP
jgi:REP element-mobilizing transposase RayT